MRYLLVLLLVCPTLADDVIDDTVKKAKAGTVAKHVALIKALGDALRERILTPALAARQPKGVFVNRILNRGIFKNELGVRGGGAYFSFVTKSNDYDHIPNIQLQQWGLQSGFHGGDCGFVQALSAENLAAATIDMVPALFTQKPALFYPTSRARLAELWRAQGEPQGPQGPGPEAYPKARVGHVYIVRSIAWNESDVLAAFQVLARDELGVTFAWKILKKYPKPARRP